MKQWLMQRDRWDVMIGAWLTREVTRVPGTPFTLTNVAVRSLLSCDLAVFVSPKLHSSQHNCGPRVLHLFAFTFVCSSITLLPPWHLLSRHLSMPPGSSSNLSTSFMTVVSFSIQYTIDSRPHGTMDLHLSQGTIARPI